MERNFNCELNFTVGYMIDKFVSLWLCFLLLMGMIIYFKDNSLPYYHFSVFAGFIYIFFIRNWLLSKEIKE